MMIADSELYVAAEGIRVCIGKRVERRLPLIEADSQSVALSANVRREEFASDRPSSDHDGQTSISWPVVYVGKRVDRRVANLGNSTIIHIAARR